MPKRADDTLKTAKKSIINYERESSGGTYKSQIEASKKWQEKKKPEQVMVRVPAGAKKLINEYVEKMAEADPTNLKYSTFNGKGYRPSVNALINYLLKEEMGDLWDKLEESEE